MTKFRRGYSVTQWIKAHKQPKGGYLPVKFFTEKKIQEDSKELLDIEFSYYPAWSDSAKVGLIVDYLSRYFILLKDSPSAKREDLLRDAFSVSLLGARFNEEVLGEKGSVSIANKLLVSLASLSKPGDLTRHSLMNAYRLVFFDQAYRGGQKVELQYLQLDLEKSQLPTDSSVESVKTLIERVLYFLGNLNEGSLESEFTFPGGFSEIVSAGDGDFLTEESLIDLKTIKGEINSNHTLQVLIYLLLGLNSTDREKFRKIKRLGFYNPRKDTYTCIDVSSIPVSVVTFLIEELQLETISTEYVKSMFLDSK